MRITNTPTLREIAAKKSPLNESFSAFKQSPWEEFQKILAAGATALTACGTGFTYYDGWWKSNQEHMASDLKTTELLKLEETCIEKTLEYMDKSLDRFQHVGKEKAEQEIAQFFSIEGSAMKRRIDTAFERTEGHYRPSSSILGCLSCTPTSGKRAIIQHQYNGRDASYHSDVEQRIKIIQGKVAELVMRDERYKPYSNGLKEFLDVDWNTKYVQDERRASEPNPPSIEEMASRTPIEPPAVVEPLIKRATSAPKETLKWHIDTLNQQKRAAIYNRGVNKAASGSGTARSAFEETFSFEKVLLVYMNTLEMFIFTAIKNLTFNLMLSLMCCKVAAVAKLFICVSVIVCLKNAFFPHRKTCHFTQWETCKTLYARGRIIVVVCSIVCGYLKLM